MVHFKPLFMVVLIGAVNCSATIDVDLKLKTMIGNLNESGQELSPNLMLGVTICKSLLSDNIINDNRLSEIVNILENLEQKFHEQYKSPDFMYEKLLKYIINDLFWSKNSEFVWKKQPLILIGSNNINSMDDYLDIIDSGNPTEEESDYCLIQIFEEMEIDNSCWQWMTMDELSYGYHLTHKLLFYMVLQKKHPNYPVKVEVEINKICSGILYEFNFIATEGYPDIFKDLLMEQLLLCGMNGFREFLQMDHLLRVIHWQSESCFEYEGICNNHTTGLGVAIYGLIGKIVLSQYHV